MFNMNDFPAPLRGLDHLVRAKTLDIANTQYDEDYRYDEDQEFDRDRILTESSTEAQAWFENATEEEREELRKRYPEDVDVKD